MRQILVFGGILASVLLTAATAKALVVAAPSIPDHFLSADCVIVGKVKLIEKKSVEAAPYKNANTKVTYQVAVVEIESAIKGAKGLTTIRVGFQPVVQTPQPPKPVPGAPQIIRRPVGFGRKNLVAGEEYLLYLKPHFQETFHVAPMYFDIVPKKNNKSFESEVALLKRCARLLENPKEGLNAKDPHDRLLTAALLLSQFSRRPEGAKNVRREPVEQELSSAILKAIASVDWSGQGWRQVDPTSRLSAFAVFNRLGLTPKDGWNPRFRNFVVEFPAAAQKWLKQNQNTFRIHRWVEVK
ncbi:MAG: hypothetical protein KatS3mg105_1280 [Gemmatales bacterium]|nr:MAG: hypothetical protein KatS3mg105_1280 [Gemmatales bacterium]